ncbi:hypothetical protein OpiT1DRAFT_05781 [Opitutaceae bacterium TAV1]|nr:hypothetical protein OpiT1DRAFT_05781 [Opitutaceae bacterium TAV1]
MKPILRPLVFTVALIALALHPESRAAIVLPLEITFDTEADYTDNFTSINGSGIVWNGEAGTLSKTGTGTHNLLFNETGLADVTVSISASFSSSSPSIGLWQGTSSTSTGFLGLVNRVSTTDVRLRIYNANLGTNLGTATPIYEATHTLASFATDTFYTVAFTAIDTDTGTNLALDFLDVSGSRLATSGLVSSTASMIGSQVGFRASSQTITLDNFAIASAIPEPATVASIFGLCALAAIAMPRRVR